MSLAAFPSVSSEPCTHEYRASSLGEGKEKTCLESRGGRSATSQEEAAMRCDAEAFGKGECWEEGGRRGDEAEDSGLWGGGVRRDGVWECAEGKGRRRWRWRRRRCMGKALRGYEGIR